MKRLRSILGIIAIFLLGMIAGGLLVGRVIDAVQRRAFVEGGGIAVADLVARRISYRLRADAAQRGQIQAILRDTAKDFESVRDQVAPQLKESLEKTETRVRAVLKPDQQKEFDTIMQRARATWSKRTGS